MAGVDIPVRGEPRWMHFTPTDGGLPVRLPLTIDFSTGFYFHREGPGLAFGGREQTLEDVAEPAARRLPVLADLPVQSSWWGYYEVSPDHNAIVGEAAEPGASTRRSSGLAFSRHPLSASTSPSSSPAVSRRSTSRRSNSSASNGTRRGPRPSSFDRCTLIVNNTRAA